MNDDRKRPRVRQVRDRHELEAALALVHDNYIRCGYMEPDPSGIRLGIHYALPSARCFVAVVDGEVIATVTLFCDSALGLPIDCVYGDELSALRAEGRSIGEVGMLADRRRSLRRALPLLLRMMKLLFWTARDVGLSDLVIAVHPKHKEFYRRMLCFREHGCQRSYHAVQGAPAVLLRIDIAAVREEDVEREHIRKLFLGSRPEGSGEGDPYRIGPEDLKYFFLERTDLLRQVSEDVLRTIEGHYPGLRLLEPQMACTANCPSGATGAHAPIVGEREQ